MHCCLIRPLFLLVPLLHLYFFYFSYCCFVFLVVFPSTTIEDMFLNRKQEAKIRQRSETFKTRWQAEFQIFNFKEVF